MYTEQSGVGEFNKILYHMLSRLDFGIKVEGVDEIVSYLVQISKPKKVSSGVDIGDFNRLEQILQMEQHRIVYDVLEVLENPDPECLHSLFKRFYEQSKLEIVNKLEKYQIIVNELNENITRLLQQKIELQNKEETQQQINDTEELLRTTENNLVGKRKEELITLIAELEKKQQDTEEYLEAKLKVFTLEKIAKFRQVLDVKKSEFFENIVIPTAVHDKTSIKQIGNIVFFNNIEDEGLIINNIFEIIEANKTNQNRPIFYIVSGGKHWYTIIQQEKQIFDLNVSSIGSNINLLPIKLESDKELTYFKYNTGTQKLQYSSGCCEMYCVLLPYLLTRCMLFNGITELKDLFIINKNNFNFQSFLYNGLCEKAFSADIMDKYYTEDKGFKDGRIELLEGQVKGSTEGSSTCLLYNSHTTFQEIFSQYLNSEINYIQYMQQDYKTENGKTKATNMKGGFIYRYAIMMSNMSDPEYRKHLQEYFEKYLDKTPEKFTEDCEKCKVLVEKYKKFTKNLGSNETEKQFFKENFQLLLSRFNKLFLGNAVCNYSVVSTSHEYQYRVNDKAYFQHLLNDYARLQGIPIEEDIHFNLEQENLIAPTPIDLTAIKKLNNSDNIVFGSNDDIGQLIPHFMKRINNDGYINLIYNNKQADTKAHYVAAQIFKDTDGIITLLYTDPLDREIDNRFKSFVEKTLGKKIEDVKIINVDNQLFEQCSNNVNMNSLLALTAIRDGGILDMQRENKPSWVDYVREKKEQEKSQQKTNLHEK